MNMSYINKFFFFETIKRNFYWHGLFWDSLSKLTWDTCLYLSFYKYMDRPGAFLYKKKSHNYKKKFLQLKKKILTIMKKILTTIKNLTTIKKISEL